MQKIALPKLCRDLSKRHTKAFFLTLRIFLQMDSAVKWSNL